MRAGCWPIHDRRIPAVSLHVSHGILFLILSVLYHWLFRVAGSVLFPSSVLLSARKFGGDRFYNVSIFRAPLKDCVHVKRRPIQQILLTAMVWCLQKKEDLCFSLTQLHWQINRKTDYWSPEVNLFATTQEEQTHKKTDIFTSKQYPHLWQVQGGTKGSWAESARQNDINNLTW